MNEIYPFFLRYRVFQNVFFCHLPQIYGFIVNHVKSRTQQKLFNKKKTQKVNKHTSLCIVVLYKKYTLKRCGEVFIQHVYKILWYIYLFAFHFVNYILDFFSRSQKKILTIMISYHQKIMTI